MANALATVGRLRLPLTHGYVTIAWTLPLTRNSVYVLSHLPPPPLLSIMVSIRSRTHRSVSLTILHTANLPRRERSGGKVLHTEGHSGGYPGGGVREHRGKHGPSCSSRQALNRMHSGCRVWEGVSRPRFLAPATYSSILALRKKNGCGYVGLSVTGQNVTLSRIHMLRHAR